MGMYPPDVQAKRDWALISGNYICPHCKDNFMVFEDDSHDFLVCEACGHSMRYEEYGFEEGEYDKSLLYPLEEDL